MQRSLALLDVQLDECTYHSAANILKQMTSQHADLYRTELSDQTRPERTATSTGVASFSTIMLQTCADALMHLYRFAFRALPPSFNNAVLMMSVSLCVSRSAVCVRCSSLNSPTRRHHSSLSECQQDGRDSRPLSSTLARGLDSGAVSQLSQCFRMPAECKTTKASLCAGLPAHQSESSKRQLLQQTAERVKVMLQPTQPACTLCTLTATAM